MGDDVRYSVVVPVYGNRDSIPALLDALDWLRGELDGSLQTVFVVDGSPDDSLTVLRSSLAGRSGRSTVLELSRNFGSFSAIRAGLAAAEGSFIAVMAADLQEPIEAVLAFLRRLEDGDVAIVVGRRSRRSDPAMTALSARMYWWLYRRLVNSAIPAGGVDVFACTREVAAILATFSETHTSLVGLLYWVGYPRTEVEYERQERHSGRSGWSFRKKLRYLADSIYAFTDLPVLLLQGLGILGVAGSLIVALGVFVGWLLGIVSEPGYTPLMLAITFSTSLILIGLGVVGSYLWRTYENGKSRPVAIVMSREDHSGGEATDGR